MRTRRTPLAFALALGIAASGAAAAQAASAEDFNTATPTKHLVIIFQENVSFDHYFATYPTALNPPGEPAFHAHEGTPSVNGLGTLVDGQPQGVLLTLNPNFLNPANGGDAINPFRLDRSQASICDQDHNYGHEVDLFPATVGAGGSGFCDAAFAYGMGKGLVMGYFDGNTVTALWRYAQAFAMSDNSYSSTFGPSTPGLLNLVAGNTYPSTPSAPSPKVVATDINGVGTLVGDLDPPGDVCSFGITVALGGQSVGDLLGITGDHLGFVHGRLRFDDRQR